MNHKNFILILFVLLCWKCVHCAPNKIQTRSSSDSALVDDIKWFFRGIGNFAATVERMLPTTNMDAKNKSLTENARKTVLVGLRHVLVGVREISMTFEQNFKTDHIKQLQQFKNATNFVNDIIADLKMWFSQIRSLAMHLYTLYNRYIPEVLFGKCIGSYLASTYPDRSYYEYPFIFLWEIYASVMPASANTNDVESTSTELYIDNDLNMAQNEISHTEDSDSYNVNGYASSKYPRHVDTNGKAEGSTSAESIFNLSSVLDDNKDKVIEDAIQQHSWKICLKLYTAESISRSLKSYFLNM